MKFITKSDELEVGKLYWMKFKGIESKPYVGECGKHSEGNLYLGPNKMWATETNPQAFENYHIYGPLDIPKEISEIK